MHTAWNELFLLPAGIDKRFYIIVPLMCVTGVAPLCKGFWSGVTLHKPAPDLFVQADLTEKLLNPLVVCDCRIYARLFQLHGTVFAIIPCNHEDWLEAEHGVISAFREMSVMMKQMQSDRC